MATRFLNILSISALLVVSAQAHAVTVHTWKDKAGVTHFSDEPGPQGTTSHQLELGEVNEPAVNAGEDFYSIANQWKRLKAERDIAKTQRLEKQKLKLQERNHLAALERQAEDTNLPPQTYPIYGPGFRTGFGNGFRRPGYGLPSHGTGAPGYNGRTRDRHRQARHPNYHSPFHDRAQPQSIRSKPLRRNSSSNARHSGGYGPRGRYQSGGSLFVRF